MCEELSPVQTERVDASNQTNVKDRKHSHRPRRRASTNLHTSNERCQFKLYIAYLNIILKYADDTYLIVPSVNSHLIHSEMQHIGFWAESNNLKLNVSKSAEIIFTL